MFGKDSELVKAWRCSALGLCSMCACAAQWTGWLCALPVYECAEKDAAHKSCSGQGHDKFDEGLYCSCKWTAGMTMIFVRLVGQRGRDETQVRDTVKWCISNLQPIG